MFEKENGQESLYTKCLKESVDRNPSRDHNAMESVVVEYTPADPD